MARPPRIEYPDAIYHVSARGNAQQPIVRDDMDRDKWVELLERTVDMHKWKVFAFALMTNHFHIFVQTPEPNLSKGTQRLNGSFAGYINGRYHCCGNLFQGRYKAVLVEREGH